MIDVRADKVKSIPSIPFQFRAYPVALDALKLTRTARAVFALVLDNARSRGWRSRLSNGTMGRILGCCSMTIKRALADLEAAGLILREFAAAGRIRTGIVVTWEGVEHSRSTERPHLEQSRSTGGTRASQGVEHSRSTNQRPGQNETQTAPILSIEEDPESVVPDGPTAAAYLRAMIQAGRRGGTQAAQPKPPCPAPSSAVEPPPPAAAYSRPTPPAGPSRTPEADAKRAVERMAGSVFKDARRAAWGPLPGRRRMTPAELQRQLADVRRKYGKAGGRIAQPTESERRSITDMGGACSR